MIGPFFTEWLGGEAPEGVTEWGVKTVKADFTTRGGFRWAFPGGWSRSDDRVALANPLGGLSALYAMLGWACCALAGMTDRRR